jgi:uncharacterized integral membrane protein
MCVPATPLESTGELEKRTEDAGPPTSPEATNQSWKGALWTILGVLALVDATLLVMIAYGLVPVLPSYTQGFWWPFGLAAILMLLGVGLIMRGVSRIRRARSLS